jgi:hypothetical protein
MAWASADAGNTTKVTVELPVHEHGYVSVTPP